MMNNIGKISSRLIAVGSGIIGGYLFLNNWFFTVDGG